MTIAHWPRLERPREKLLSSGAAMLSDAELLAVFLQTGTRGKTALDPARELILQFGGLSRLLAANQQELCAHVGVGMAKAAGFAAMKELFQRQMLEELK